MSTSSLPSSRRRGGLVAKLPVLLLVSCLQVGSVTAHSFVSSIHINGLAYSGFWPLPPAESDPNTKSVGWITTVYDQGYVNQTGFSVPAAVIAGGSNNAANVPVKDEDDLEITCHRGSRSTAYHAPAEAGSQIHVQWNGWPISHKGPVMSYLAFCGDSGPASNNNNTNANGTTNVRGCDAVRKSDLSFFKIEEAGLVNTTTADNSTAPQPTDLAEMTWASDLLIANNNSWIVSLPERLRPGFYVLRHEVVALHNASRVVGAQAYPQCLNLMITEPSSTVASAGRRRGEGGGYILPKGVKGSALYDAQGRDRASFDLDIYAPFEGEQTSSGGQAADGLANRTYPIPGPGVALWGKNVTLSHPVPTAAGTPVVAPKK